jgi:hypothetical protein
LIDSDGAVSIDTQDDHVFRRLPLRIGRRGMRNLRVDTGRHRRRDRHENHEQDKKDVDERSHVDVSPWQSSFSKFLHALKTPRRAELFPDK